MGDKIYKYTVYPFSERNEQCFQKIKIEIAKMFNVHRLRILQWVRRSAVLPQGETRREKFPTKTNAIYFQRQWIIAHQWFSE